MNTPAWLFNVAVFALCAGASHAATFDLQGVGGAPVSVHVRSLKELRFTSTLRQQFDFSCGSAAVATLLTYHYDRPTTEQEAFEYMYAHGDQEKIRREGFSLLDMKHFLDAQAFYAAGFETTLDKIAGAGLPAIALVSDNGYNHFVVIKGVKDGRVLIGDSASGRRAVPQSTFEHMWTNGLLFLIYGSSNSHMPKFNDEAEWRAVPRAPLAVGARGDGNYDTSALPRYGPGDF
jgi:predicted double-glycine peptidase